MNDQHAALSGSALPIDSVGLLEGLVSTRAIRRYRDEPIPSDALRAILFAASRAPSGSNRQPFRFIVLSEGPRAAQAKELIAGVAARFWTAKFESDGYAKGSGSDASSPKARQARAMTEFVDNFARTPVVILPCLVRYREPNAYEGASIFPACQNILLAARALGYGGVLTGWHAGVETELRELLTIPDEVFIAATISLGKPVGGHGPVRRLPLAQLVFEDAWGNPAPWAIDPPGTRHTQAGPPRSQGGA